jgi:hypothetical protein
MKHARCYFLSCLALAIFAAACNAGTDKAATFGHYDEQPAAGPVRVVHVHGLGINPKDGSLYAATHTGLFLIRENGSAERVGQSYQDTMGFTVTGPDQFLGSGHPDLRDYQSGRWPPHLGLVRSEDAGRTWTSVSLKGKADFHALKTIHDRIYGFNSSDGTLMVSKNAGKTWETRAKLGLLDFAVSPQDEALIFGAVETGLAMSTDGGTSWQPVSGPKPVVLFWQQDSRLWALDKAGNIWLSTNVAGTWNLQGSVPGSPEAFLDTGQVLYASVHEEGIYSSNDDGRTWKLFYKDQPQGGVQ